MENETLTDDIADLRLKAERSRKWAGAYAATVALSVGVEIMSIATSYVQVGTVISGGLMAFGASGGVSEVLRTLQVNSELAALAAVQAQQAGLSEG